MKIAVLGCGPTGLLAAHAVELAGHEVQVISNRVKSKIAGAMYIHRPIPDLTSPQPEATVRFEKEGHKQGYARKVYGNSWARCSWDHFPEGELGIWSMERAYNALWDRFESDIDGAQLGTDDIPYLVEDYDQVISSVPAPAICEGGHTFPSQTIHIRSSQEPGPNVITYNGDPCCPWYRRSRLFGTHSMEFGHQVSGSYPGVKPLGTDCGCHPKVLRVGRFGKWEKGVLVHHAFQEVLSAIAGYPEAA